MKSKQKPNVGIVPVLAFLFESEYIQVRNE